MRRLAFIRYHTPPARSGVRGSPPSIRLALIGVAPRSRRLLHAHVQTWTRNYHSMDRVMERAPLSPRRAANPAATDDRAMLDAAHPKRPREGAPAEFE